MSCGCSSTTTPSPSITCGSCGYQCTSCTCPVDPIVMPTVTCADPATCQEIYPLECVQYTGEDIKCSPEASVLYPNVTHIVATNGDMLPNILNNINSQLCYLFSADFISEMFTKINADSELSSLLCTISNDCTVPTALICPTVSSVTYNYDNTLSQYYLSAQINYVPNATNYAYKFYTESTYNSGTFDTVICSGSIVQPSTALPITLSCIVPSATINTSSKNYAVLVYATGTLTASGKNPASYSTFVYNTLNSGGSNCGINKYVGVSSDLTCSPANLNGSFRPIKNLQFTFNEEASNPTSYAITGYKVHFYLRSISTPYVYNYINLYDITTYTPGLLHTYNLIKSTVSLKTWTTSGSTVAVITSTLHGMSSGTTITVSSSSNTTNVPNGDYIITVIDANTFTIPLLTASTSSGTLSHTIPYTYSDAVVAMISTITINPELCSKGVPPRVNGSFDSTSITTYTSTSGYNVFKNFQ